MQIVSEEIFDIVNERDEVIGQLPRREVHRRGLMHRAVHVLIFNSKGQVFLQKRSKLKDTFPQRWDSSAAGHLNPGEEYDACAMREVQEELGFQMPSVPERILRIAACEETGQEFVWVYRCAAEGPFALNVEEIESGDWFAPEYVSRWIEEKPDDFAPSLICIWQKVFLSDRGTNRPALGSGVALLQNGFSRALLARVSPNDCRR